MSLGRLRIVPYLGLAAPVIGSALWSHQDWSGALSVGSFGGVALILLWNRPREVVGWLLLLTAVAGTLGNYLPGSPSQVVDGRADAGITLYAWLNSWGSDLFFGSFVALAALFPSGRFPTGRLGMAARIAVSTMIGFAVALAFAPTGTVTFDDGSAASVQLPLPIFHEWTGWGFVRSDLVYVASLVALVISTGTLVMRFRKAVGSERTQYKWLLAALAATLGSVIFAFAMIALVDPTGNWMWWPAKFAYPMIPVAIGIAIRRYHLYDIDRIISRSVSYLVVTGLLAAVFGGLVVALEAALAGITQGGTLAVAASTLAAFALFQPVRRRVQAAVDRRFDRARVDSQRLVDVFAERLRDEVDLGEVRIALLTTATSAVRPEHGSVWLRGGGA